MREMTGYSQSRKDHHKNTDHHETKNDHETKNKHKTENNFTKSDLGSLFWGGEP